MTLAQVVADPAFPPLVVIAFVLPLYWKWKRNRDR